MAGWAFSLPIMAESGRGFWATVLKRDMSGCFFCMESVGLAWSGGGLMETMLSLLESCSALSGVSGELGFWPAALKGEKVTEARLGGFSTTLPAVLCSGRRGGLAAEGMGAWLIMAAVDWSK